MLAEEKRVKERAMFYLYSFAFGLIGTLLGLEKEVCALKRDLTTCEKTHADLEKGRDAAEVREGSTEGKLRVER